MQHYRIHPTRRLALLAAVLLAVLTTEARAGEHEDRHGVSSLGVTRRFAADASHFTIPEFEVNGHTLGGQRSAEVSVEKEIGWDYTGAYGGALGVPLVRFRATARARDFRLGEIDHVWIELQIHGADAMPLEHLDDSVALALTVDGTFEDTRDSLAEIKLRPLGFYDNQAVFETTSSASVHADLTAAVRNNLGRRTARIDGVGETSCEIDGEEYELVDDGYDRWGRDLRILIRPGAVRLECHLAARFGLAWGTADLETEAGLLRVQRSLGGMNSGYRLDIDPLSLQLFGISYPSAMREASRTPVLDLTPLPGLPTLQLR